MDLMPDVVVLSRIQFALTIMFHYLFPPLTIGMSVVLVYLEAMYLIRRQPIYETAAKFWTKIFALHFALGVATGIVMAFQFGTNWAAYSRFVGDVFGSPLAAEGIFAFFLESGFLAVLVFGWDRVSPKFHFFATLFVAVGGLFSALWILIANSWMQTPAGHRIVQMTRDGEPWFVDGEPVMRAQIVSYWEVIFNPSTIERITHTLIAALIVGSFFILSISAYYLVKRRHEEFARRSFTGALVLAFLASLAALVSGHFNAQMIAEHQPAKLAAFEGHFKTDPADLTILGWPDVEEGRMRFNLAIPGGLSFLVHEDFDEPVLGLDAFEREHWPPVVAVFMSYHIMVGLGLFFIVLTGAALWLRWRQRLFDKRWLMWVFVLSVGLPFVANHLGWVSAEMGRQPWVVYPPMERDAAGELLLNDAGMVQYRVNEGMRTRDGVSEVVTAGQVLGSIVMFSLIYLLLFGLWVFLLNHKIQHGPEPAAVDRETTSESLLRTAAGRTLHRDSMTEAKDEPNREP